MYSIVDKSSTQSYQSGTQLSLHAIQYFIIYDHPVETMRTNMNFKVIYMLLKKTTAIYLKKIMY